MTQKRKCDFCSLSILPEINPNKFSFALNFFDVVFSFIKEFKFYQFNFQSQGKISFTNHLVFLSLLILEIVILVNFLFFILIFRLKCYKRCRKIIYIEHDKLTTVFLNRMVNVY